MDLPGYLPEETRPLGPHPADYPHDLLTVEGSSTSQELKTELEMRRDPEESCPVCGDRVSGYHYGLLTCESCKGFFKRSVQNNKHYTCAERQSCPMNPSQRKRCPYCRFQKCLAVGMKREAVRADRMRGGRNKFGPLYRRDRQMKQQTRSTYHQTNTTPYRIKMETTQMHWPAASNDVHLMSSHTLSSDHFHQSQAYPSGMGQSDLPIPLDCTVNRDRVLTPPSLPYGGFYHHSLPGYPTEKREAPFSCCPAPATPPVYPTTSNLSTPLTTPTTTPSSTPSSTPSLTPGPGSTPTPGSSSAPTLNFLSQLLEGEPDEGQLCAKVLASLQREQASRGKHDRLNTFSIMCKMADQTLFGLVEWARNSPLFKEIKVMKTRKL